MRYCACDVRAIPGVNRAGRGKGGPAPSSVELDVKKKDTLHPRPSTALTLLSPDQEQYADRIRVNEGSDSRSTPSMMTFRLGWAATEWVCVRTSTGPRELDATPHTGE